MQIILLEKVNKLGGIGSVVTVKDGYARNFLIPQKKALRATKTNMQYYETQKSEIEKDNSERNQNAEMLLSKFEDLTVKIVRQAGEDGRLYGSVSNSDIVKALNVKIDTKFSASNIVLISKFKEIGQYTVEVQLHPEVIAKFELLITRNGTE